MTSAMSRRALLQGSGIGLGALAAASITSQAWGAPSPGGPTGSTGPSGPLGPASSTIDLTGDWSFGRYRDGVLQPDFDASAMTRVNLPHTVTELSWKDWDASTWEHVWAYRRQVDMSALPNKRSFVEVDAALVDLTLAVNGAEQTVRRGGFLPVEWEVTRLLKPNQSNTIAFKLDSNWLRVPPFGSPNGNPAIDMYAPGGIHRDVRLKIVPFAFVRDVQAVAENVLDPGRRQLRVSTSIDTTHRVKGILEVTLRRGAQAVRTKSVEVDVAPGAAPVGVLLDGLEHIALWEIEDPVLYDLEVALVVRGVRLHDHRSRIGFRDSMFRDDGYFLNGRRVKLIGLNRHEMYPYLGFAAPARIKREDARILREDLACNFVRTSHYPPSTEFLQACDELGLLVFEEIPGWHYYGTRIDNMRDPKAADRDPVYEQLHLDQIREMILRDRNHPSIITWGLLINESRTIVPDLWKRADALAKCLDTRQTSGAGGYRDDLPAWGFDIRGYNDYAKDARGVSKLEAPQAGFPYLVTEAVGQFPNFANWFNWSEPNARQQFQAFCHAAVHDQAAGDPRHCGVAAWVGFDYQSPSGRMWGWDRVDSNTRGHGVKSAGIGDCFRILKPGAAAYTSQTPRSKRLVLDPAFYWHVGQSPYASAAEQPPAQAAIGSNCEQIRVTVDGRVLGTLLPDRKQFPNLPNPLFFADFSSVDWASAKELLLEGLVGGRVVVARRATLDTATDRLVARVDADEIAGDRRDATRVWFRVEDRHGSPRPWVRGTVSFSASGPVEIVGDNPFDGLELGATGAVYVRGTGRGTGKVTVSHADLGTSTVTVRMR